MDYTPNQKSLISTPISYCSYTDFPVADEFLYPLSKDTKVY
jgi:hypothetical protein